MIAIPILPLALGTLGLVPFIAWAAQSQGYFALPWYPPLMQSSFLFPGYAGVILGFMAAMHWAWAMQSQSHMQPQSQSHMQSQPQPQPQSQPQSDGFRSGYLSSVALALGGWICAASAFAAGFILLFLLAFWVDWQAVGKNVAPAWYLPLRAYLTSVVCVCLAVVAFF